MSMAMREAPSTMKGPLSRTKIVLRHLPPTISQSSLVEQIDGHFSGRYCWISFRHGNVKKRCISYSRGYIDFQSPEDVAEFVKFFDGHVFVNEKGSQFKTIVEYAPSQRVPKTFSRTDGREGTINKDPHYMEFFEFISKPPERTPSAEIQLARREASGSMKNDLIVTPLMEFVRQKRAARSLPYLKSIIKTSKATYGNPNSVLSKQFAETRRKTTTMCVVQNTTNITKESTIIKVPKQDDVQISMNSVASSVSASQALHVKSGVCGTDYIWRKKVLQSKEKEHEIPQFFDPTSISTKTFSDVVGNTRTANSLFGTSGSYLGEPAVFFSDDEISILSAPFKFTLVGKLFTGCPSVCVIKASFEAFVPGSSFFIGPLDNNHVLIIFNNEDDYNRFRLREEWLSKKFQMSIFKWSPDFRIGADSSIAPVTDCLSQQNIAKGTKSLVSSVNRKPNQQYKATGRIINSNVSHQSPSSSLSVAQSEQQIQPLILEKHKKSPTPQNMEFFGTDNKKGCPNDKQTMNKDRPDRLLWIPAWRLLQPHANELQKSHIDSVKESVENVHDPKDFHNIPSILSKEKPFKRGGSSSNGMHEKQIWVQKSSSCSS